MRFNKFIFLIFPFLVSIFSCKDNLGKRSEMLKTIDISKTYKNEKEVFLSSIADSITYISLQTNSSILLDQIKRPWMNIQFIQDRIFISDKKQLLAFNYSGKFINKIGRQGNGPGEFVHIDNFTILEKKKQVIIMNLYKKELLIYNFQGSFIRAIKTDFWPSEIASFNKELIVLGNTKGNRIFSDYKTASILDEDYEIQNLLISHGQEREIEKNKTIARWQMANFYNYCDTLSHWEFQYDTIWRIPEKTIAYPAYKIELGKDKLPFKYILSEFSNQNHNEFITTERVLETKKYFFFRIAYKRFLRHILYCKDDNSSVCINHLFKGRPYASFINDIDGGMPFWPDGVIDENKIFSLMFGIELKSKIEENKLHNKFQPVNYNLSNLLRNTQITDNPIVMIVKIKKK